MLPGSQQLGEGEAESQGKAPVVMSQLGAEGAGDFSTVSTLPLRPPEGCYVYGWFKFSLQKNRDVWFLGHLPDVGSKDLEDTAMTVDF